MKTKLFFVILVFVAGLVVAEDNTINTPDPEEFLAACQAGFQQDYGNDPNAKELGCGSCGVVYSGQEPPNRIPGEIYIDVPRRTPEEVVVDMPEETVISEARPAVWYAWTDGKLLYVVLSRAMDFTETFRVMDCTSGPLEEDRWWAWASSFLIAKRGGSFWWREANYENKCLTILTIGRPGDDPSTSLCQRLNELTALAVISDVKADT